MLYSIDVNSNTRVYGVDDPNSAASLSIYRKQEIAKISSEKGKMTVVDLSVSPQIWHHEEAN
jgi:hypothetical protein